MAAINLWNAKLRTRFNPCNCKALLQSHTVFLMNHISSFTRERFWKQSPPWASRAPVAATIKSCRRHISGKISQLCTQGFLPLLSHSFWKGQLGEVLWAGAEHTKSLQDLHCSCTSWAGTAFLEHLAAPSKNHPGAFILPRRQKKPPWLHCCSSSAAQPELQPLQTALKK